MNATATKTSPDQRRYDAIKDLVARRYNHADNAVVGTAAEIAADIETLVGLGRTQRWTETVAGWADMVRDEANDLRWALIQGSVFAGYAAE